MYVSEIYIQDNGPIANLHLKVPFHPSGLPIPLVIVGRNGSGKTTLMSVLADALLEGAVASYDDIIIGSSPLGHNWFRVVGGKTIRHGSHGSLALVKVVHKESSYFFHEEGGHFDPTSLASVPPTFASLSAGTKGNSHKEFSIPQDISRAIYASGPYVYFPTSRSEPPYWMNNGAVELDAFKLSARFSSQLDRSIVVERSLERFSQWALTLLVEMRADFAMTVSQQGRVAPAIVGDISGSLAAQQTWQSLNQILRIIISDPSARFVWLGRNSAHKLGIANSQGLIGQGLDALSGGQASLLSIFGTLLQYGDCAESRSPIIPSEVEGICVVDEVDAHMHVDLLTDALPSLIKLYPKVQFILTSHSPFFGIGLEKHLSSDGVSIVDLPSGLPIAAEAYHDFERALITFKSTKAFGDLLTSVSQESGPPIVWLAGETDPLYFQCAAEVLNHPVKDLVSFEWIGSKDNSGQGFNTGDDALNKAVSLFISNPDLVTRHIIVLYDSDVNKPIRDLGRLHVRTMPFRDDNGIAKKGVENLLPPSVFTEAMYDHATKLKEYGEEVSTKTLNKMKLCQTVCQYNRDPEVFAYFRPILDLIYDIVS